MKALSLVIIVLVNILAIGQLKAQQSITVKHVEVTETIELEGLVEAVKQSTVSAQTSGTIVQLPVDVDDAVQAQQLIVGLDDTEQQARVNRSRAAVESANATLADARRQFERVKDLYQQEVASQSEFDQVSTQLETSQARLAEANAALQEAEEQLSYTRVKAPYAGIVTERFVELGESVRPGQPLISGLSLEHLRVVTELPQSYAQYVRDNRSADIQTHTGRKLTIGSMTFYPYADERSHTFRLRLNLTDPNGSLFPGMLVTVHLDVGKRQQLQVPLSALLERGELRGVFVKVDDGWQLRQVRVGAKNGDRVEILSGLKAGEQVAVVAGELINE
ncbi:efflux RND transporter periplasmic adaptor subunit [Idiomarina seosinensis]|uniref:efflux RND transporter periplasmic adaptor subunit n=1 Tax=Idiomarina seosinensis TaxID=281739 RepID=UPI00384FF4BE